MPARSTSFQAIGTKWDIQIQTGVRDDEWARLLGAIDDRIQVFDKAYSRFRPDSLITHMSQSAGSYLMPADGRPLFDFYQQLYDATNGSVTPLIGQTMVEAGYDATYSLRKKTLRQPPSWESVMKYDGEQVTISQPVLLDFGAAGKGYLVDIIGQLLEDRNVLAYIINAGGDIRHRSADDQCVSVGLENPLDVSEAIGIAQLSNASLCASAGSKRKWSDLNHIIDPRTLQSPTEIVATWVIAADTMTADGLATALFFTPPRKLLRQFSFSYALMHDDMSLEHAADFPVKLFETA